MNTRLGVGIAASLLALSVVAAPAFAATTQTTLQKEVTAGWKSIATNIKKDQQSVKRLVNRVQKLHNSCLSTSLPFRAVYAMII